MKTFNVKKTTRDAKNVPLKTEIIGTVTAYTFTEAMRKAAEKYNNRNWADISVELKNTNRTNAGHPAKELQ